MKLPLVVIIAAFLCLVSTTIRNAVFYTRTLEQKVSQEFLSYSAKRFIAQSFKEACNGKGFNSLEQWQLVCNSLFGLDSITYEEERDGLMHAKWTGADSLKNCSGEVYIKMEDRGYL